MVFLQKLQWVKSCTIFELKCHQLLSDSKLIFEDEKFKTIAFWQHCLLVTLSHVAPIHFKWLLKKKARPFLLLCSNSSSSCSMSIFVNGSVAHLRKHVAFVSLVGSQTGLPLIVCVCTCVFCMCGVCVWKNLYKFCYKNSLIFHRHSVGHNNS